MTAKKTDVIIIGAGLSGLSAAVWLKKAGYSVLVIDKADDIGGKLRTDQHEGFTLDRGFQVFLTAYPEAKKILHYDDLSLKRFTPGAVLLHEGKQISMHDPFRDPSKLFGMLFFKLAGIGDKLKLLRLRSRLKEMSYSDVFEQYEAKTSTVLNKKHFSKTFINAFLKPFFSGIFLENELETSRRMFDFVFKMMNEGSIAQPEQGIAALARQLGNRLEPHELRLNTDVSHLSTGRVELSSGEILESRYIIVATDANAHFFNDFKTPEKYDYVGGTTVYFSADKAPVDHKMIMLNTAKDKLTNHVVVMSNVNPALAPEGKHLIAVCVNGIPSVSDDALIAGIRKELEPYFQTADWRLIRSYRIKQALPKQASVLGDINPSRFTLDDGIYLCGDYLLYGSQNAALRMGRKVANKIVKDDHPEKQTNRRKKKYSKYFEEED